MQKFTVCDIMLHNCLYAIRINNHPFIAQQAKPARYHPAPCFNALL
jgi:hypothetical protein